VQPVDKLLAAKVKFVEELKDMPVAIHTSEANEQHYEVGGIWFMLLIADAGGAGVCGGKKKPAPRGRRVWGRGL
jgi:hypothetical protein